MTKAQRLIDWINEYQMPDTMGDKKMLDNSLELAKQGIMTFPRQSHILTDIGLGARAMMVLEFLKRMSDEQLEEIVDG